VLSDEKKRKNVVTIVLKVECALSKITKPHPMKSGIKVKKSQNKK
jgi:hypothetical protein